MQSSDISACFFFFYGVLRVFVGGVDRRGVCIGSASFWGVAYEQMRDGNKRLCRWVLTPGWSRWHGFPSVLGGISIGF